ncbi:MAG: hypothetical protein FJX72_05550, partial [Armatimonadetes bacterium]|nr:hypothetical protein [Armatimonadota bacterium]
MRAWAVFALVACTLAPAARAQNRPDTLWVRTGFVSSVEDIAVSPDGQTLAVAGDVRIDLYRLSDGVCLR